MMAFLIRSLKVEVLSLLEGKYKASKLCFLLRCKGGVVACLVHSRGNLFPELQFSLYIISFFTDP